MAPAVLAFASRMQWDTAQMPRGESSMTFGSVLYCCRLAWVGHMSRHLAGRSHPSWAQGMNSRSRNFSERSSDMRPFYRGIFRFSQQFGARYMGAAQQHRPVSDPVEIRDLSSPQPLAFIRSLRRPPYAALYALPCRLIQHTIQSGAGAVVMSSGTTANTMAPRTGCVLVRVAVFVQLTPLPLPLPAGCADRYTSMN